MLAAQQDNTVSGLIQRGMAHSEFWDTTPAIITYLAAEAVS